MWRYVGQPPDARDQLAQGPLTEQKAPAWADIDAAPLPEKSTPEEAQAEERAFDVGRCGRLRQGQVISRDHLHFRWCLELEPQQLGPNLDRHPLLDREGLKTIPFLPVEAAEADPWRDLKIDVPVGPCPPQFQESPFQSGSLVPLCDTPEPSRSSLVLQGLGHTGAPEIVEKAGRFDALK
jgi:hypothetical protein